MYCKYCGKETQETDIFCSCCGKRIDKQDVTTVKPEQNSKKNKSWLVALAIGVIVIAFTVAAFKRSIPTHEDIYDVLNDTLTYGNGTWEMLEWGIKDVRQISADGTSPLLYEAEVRVEMRTNGAIPVHTKGTCYLTLEHYEGINGWGYYSSNYVEDYQEVEDLEGMLWKAVNDFGYYRYAKLEKPDGGPYVLKERMFDDMGNDITYLEAGEHVDSEGFFKAKIIYDMNFVDGTNECYSVNYSTGERQTSDIASILMIDLETGKMEDSGKKAVFELVPEEHLEEAKRELSSSHAESDEKMSNDEGSLALKKRKSIDWNH